MQKCYLTIVKIKQSHDPFIYVMDMLWEDLNYNSWCMDFHYKKQDSLVSCECLILKVVFILK